MRNFSAILLSTLVACGGGNDAPSPDAPVVIDAAPDAPRVDAMPDAQIVDLSCTGNSAPVAGSAVDPIPVSGTAQNFNVIAMQAQPVDGALVVFIDDLNGNGQLDTDTTANGGIWALSLPSGTDPVEGHIEASKATFRPVRLYAPSPLTAALTDIPLLVLSNSDFAIVVAAAGATQSANNGTVGMIVADCSNAPVANSVPSVKQNGVDVGTVFDASALQPGLFVFFDVPPGATTVDASFSGMSFREHVIDVVAGTTSTTAVKPGF